MTSRRVFLRHALVGTATMATGPVGFMKNARPRLWIADSDPAVRATLRLLMRYYVLAELREFLCKQHALTCLQTEVLKPTLLITDFAGGAMRGDEFVRLARKSSPTTRLILFSAVIGHHNDWIALAGRDAPAPDVIIGKPDIQKLITIVRQIL